MTEYAPKNDVEEHKLEMDLLPLDLLSKMLCPAYSEGLVKYYKESWRKGFQTSRMMAACLRHLTAFYYEGEDFDAEAEAIGIKKHHLGAAVFCLISMYNDWLNHPELDDRPSKQRMLKHADDVAALVKREYGKENKKERKQSWEN